MHAMNSPKYVRTRWTEERRKAASEAAKRKWQERRAAERKAVAKVSPITELSRQIWQERMKAFHSMEAARVAFYENKEKMKKFEEAAISLQAALKLVGALNFELEPQ